MKCGRCGRSYVSAGGSKWPRFLCAGRRETGTCDNRRTISARIVEQCTLGAIEHDLLDERVVAEVVREYAAERKRLKASRLQSDRKRLLRLGEVERAIKNLITLVESGADPRSVLPRLKELEAERGRLQEAEGPLSGGVVDIQPAVAHHYRMIVRNLRAELAYPPPAEAELASRVEPSVRAAGEAI